MQLDKAQALAKALISLLNPYCRQIQVAGSIRRAKPDPKDIEIVFIPATTYRQVDLFGARQTRNLTDDILAQLIENRILRRDDQVKRWGPKYKRLIHVASGAVVELFAATQENWGLILALRTGPADFNRMLVTSSIYGGAMPLNMRMHGGHLWRQDTRLNTPTEESFFDALNLPTWPPHQRTQARVEAHLSNPTRTGIPSQECQS